MPLSERHGIDQNGAWRHDMLGHGLAGGGGPQSLVGCDCSSAPCVMGQHERRTLRLGTHTNVRTPRLVRARNGPSITVLGG